MVLASISIVGRLEAVQKPSLMEDDVSINNSKVQPIKTPSSIIPFFQSVSSLLIQKSSLEETVHPNLIFTDSEIPQLQENAETSHLSLWRSIFHIAEAFLEEDPLPELAPNYDTRNYQWIIMHLAFAYLISEEDRFAEKAITFALAIANYSDITIGASGYELQRAHLLMAMSFCYDWLFNYMAADVQTTLRNRIALEASILYSDFQTELRWWTKAFRNNHNWISGTSLGIAGFTLLTEEDDAVLWVNRSLQNFYNIESLLLSDGTNPEGVGYWEYAVRHLMLLLEVVKFRTGMNLYSSPFFKNTSMYRVYFMMPNRQDVGYFSDCPRIGNWRGPAAICFRLADEFNDGYAQWAGLATGPNVGKPDLWNNQSGSIIVQDFFSSSGEYSAKVVDCTDTARTGIISDHISIITTQRLDISVLVYVPDFQQITIGIIETDSSLVQSTKSYNQRVNPGEWVNVSTSFVINPDTMIVEVFLSPTCESEETGFAWFDDAKLRLDAIDQNVLPNPDFEFSPRSDPLAFLWYNSAIQPKSPSDLPLNRLFPEIGIISSRTGWAPSDALFFFKAGPFFGKNVHEDPDHGSMIFYAQDKHILIEDEYTKNRYKATYRHNTLVANGFGQFREYQLYPVNAGAQIVSYEPTQWMTYFKAEMNASYPSDAQLVSYQREGWFINSYKLGLVILSDYVKLNGTGTVDWFFHTDGIVTEVANQNIVILNISGLLFAKVLIYPQNSHLELTERRLGPSGISNKQNGYYLNISSNGQTFRLFTIYIPIESLSDLSADLRSISNLNMDPLEVDISTSSLQLYFLSLPSVNPVQTDTVNGNFKHIVTIKFNQSTYVSAAYCTEYALNDRIGIEASNPISISGKYTPDQVSLIINNNKTVQITMPILGQPIYVAINDEKTTNFEWDGKNSIITFVLSAGINEVSLRITPPQSRITWIQINISLVMTLIILILSLRILKIKKRG
jgi:hypothetical protein